MANLKELNHFLAVIKDTYTLRDFTGIELIQQLKKYSNNLKLEIDEYRITHDPERWEAYRKFVVDKIKMTEYDETVDSSSKHVQKYLKTYASSLDEVENDQIYNSDFNTLLSEFYFEFRNPDTKQESYHCQRNFVDFYKTFYIMQVLEYSNCPIPEPIKITKFRKDIFKSEQSQLWFHYVMNETAFFVDGNIVSGFQGYAHAIYKNDDCRSKIFRLSLKLKNYINFLNEEFGANITSDRSLSAFTEEYIKDVAIKIGNYEEIQNAQ